MREMNSRRRSCASDERKFRAQNLMLQAQLMSIQDRCEYHTRAALRTTNAPARGSVNCIKTSTVGPSRMLSSGTRDTDISA